MRGPIDRAGGRRRSAGIRIGFPVCYRYRMAQGALDLPAWIRSKSVSGDRLIRKTCAMAAARPGATANRVRHAGRCVPTHVPYETFRSALSAFAHAWRASGRMRVPGMTVSLDGRRPGGRMCGAAPGPGAGAILRRARSGAGFRRATAAAVRTAIDVVQCRVFAVPCLAPRDCGAAMATGAPDTPARPDGGDRPSLRAISQTARSSATAPWARSTAAPAPARRDASPTASRTACAGTRWYRWPHRADCRRCRA